MTAESVPPRTDSIADRSASHAPHSSPLSPPPGCAAPAHRAALRDLTRENRLSVEDLIWPVFVRDGEGVEEPVASMPGVIRRSVDRVVEAAPRRAALGIPAICLFPYTDPALKTAGLRGGVEPRQPDATARSARSRRRCPRSR